MNLPALNLKEQPVRHADCCLSLSSKLLDILTAVFSDTELANRPRTVLSIGSGTGLLETLWLENIESRSQADDASAGLVIEGIEVHQLGSRAPANKYLPEQAINTVRGTWELSSRLQDPGACGLIFVYPRQPDLVTGYVKEILETKLGIGIVVWLGPMADWDAFEPCFRAAAENGSAFQLRAVKKGSDAGLGEYEMMAVFVQ
ncbi:hypothetical protein B0J13DRAFT_80848 [Dactylonectria estremocensis]|uniref:Uncharacterized protein n=1 Tax=Dactylonectria estremocensis TaxID=1079267 RepID=A0A9P9EFP1_9HYPO|nr:hypothetical protein B0J13DRAFT_80848 [Dactylonectria estremocensis]